ncbi:unnamed protein product [Psylliodes chrysocephalus]|uniref:RIB43A-like with coiled-coils protein 2 n=1 Tax=Psylliodes chrysocephalus TaxID=3402493 RepID=A0A9P0CMV2_9CUCU|nr:unnamed protein product [Psylliodes chrysocephala]
MLTNFQILTEKDRKEAAALEARRRRDEERKQRIFNPRVRLMGLDIDGLDRQVEERRQKEKDDKEVTQIFHNQIKKADELALFMENKEKEERFKLNRRINEYRRNYQRPEDRREFDLNNPGYVLNQVPCRGVVDDPKLGISAAQKFEGEDLAADARRKIQHEEIKSWLGQQMREKELAEKDQKMAEEAYKAAMLARDHRALELEEMEKECRRKLQKACIKYNEALMKEKAFEREQREREDTEDKMADICNFLNSDLMTENPNVAQSNLGPNRRICAYYKGMSLAEQKAITVELQTQIEEKRIRKEQERRREMEMDSYVNGINREIYLMDQDTMAKQKQRYKELNEENRRLAEEQNNRKKFLNKVVYTGMPSDEFYDQFNRGSR